ncbi:PGRP-LA [Trypoxylus dichotomus]
MKLIRVNSRHRAKKIRNGYNNELLPHINRANMDYAALPSKTQSSSSPSISTCLPKRLLVCFAALAVISVIVIVSVIFTVELPATELDVGTTTENYDNDSSNGFHNISGTTKYNISDHRFYTIRDWGGRRPLYEVNVTKPIHYVIISHSAGAKCTTFAECAAQMRNMQDLHVSTNSPNIGYNFAIGGDGEIYEGRGWNTRNFHRDSTIGVCFIGNYVYEELTDWMVDALIKLLESGLYHDELPQDYQIVAHNQTYATLSPGQNVYKVIKQFSNFYSGIVPNIRY